MRTLLSGLFIGMMVTPLTAGGPKSHPKTILVIRHAEKPDRGPDLSDVGKKRAEALPGLFRKSATRPDPFPAPDFIFAAKESEESNRPVETVLPLAAAFKLDIDKKIKNRDYTEVKDELYSKPKYNGKTVLVCWHHGEIPDLLHALGIDPKPRPIDGAVYDRVWAVTFDEKGNAQLTDKPQALLPGDSQK